MLYVFYFLYGHKQAVIFLFVDLDSVMALQTDLTSDEELSTTIDLSDAQVKNNLLQAASCREKEALWKFTVEYTVLTTYLKVLSSEMDLAEIRLIR